MITDVSPKRRFEYEPVGGGTSGTSPASLPGRKFQFVRLSDRLGGGVRRFEPPPARDSADDLSGGVRDRFLPVRVLPEGHAGRLHILAWETLRRSQRGVGQLLSCA